MAEGVVTIPFPGQPLVFDSTVASDSPRPAGLTAFYAGPENRLIEPAIEGVLGGQPTAYNPLVFYGPSGTGKSHLVRGLTALWRVRHGTRRIILTTCAEFAQELVEAIETQAVEDFRVRYRTAGMAVFENIGELAGKRMAQEELVCTLDALTQCQTQIVVTASAAPESIAGLAPALVSRLSAGLAVPLASPGPDARLALLRQWCELRELDLPDSLVRLLAGGLEGTVPELLGAMIQLELPARIDRRPLDAQTIRDFLAERGPQRPGVHEIASATARHFSLRLSDLRGTSRRRPLVRARDVAMLLARSLTQQSLQRIGQYFGDRDHTTVLHACRKAEELLRTDPAIREAVERIQQKFQGGRCKTG